jgi:CheY-like chemotaxis protein
MLVVEDNTADVAFLKEAITASQTATTMWVVGDGRDAMQFLRREAAFSDAPRPDVIVLDLNLPVMNGQAVLSEIASDTKLNTIPVAILTTSTFETHLCDMYPPGRCLYFTKTDELERLGDVVREIDAHARAARRCD